MFHFNGNDSFTYVGEFWLPNDKEKPFSGYLIYTLEKGLSVKFLKGHSFKESKSKIDTIHGFVETIGKITLINPLANGQ